MKVIRVDYNYDSREDSIARFVALGDIHRGNPWMDEKHFYKALDWIEENDCYVILMGDYGECINAKDPRHDYNALHEDFMTPDKQYRQVLKDLERIKDKVVVMLDGNHDYNFWRRHNHNYTNWIATDLNIPYGGISSYIRFNFRRKTGKGRSGRRLNIYAHHGWTAARTDSYKVKVIHDLKNIYADAHIYLMGHVHRLGEALPTVHLYVDGRYKPREFVQRYYFTGSFIKGHEPGIGSYVEARGYSPTMLGAPIIEVKPNRVDGRHKDRPTFAVRYKTMDWI